MADTHRTVKKGLAGTRRGRTDGDATRARILDAAGRLFAEHGYQNTTSKAICARAETNIAAVNYHFGSRDGLYMAVVSEVMSHLLDLEYLTQVASSDIAPEEKLSRMIDGLVHGLIDEKSWHPKVWVREILTPSPMVHRILEQETLPRAELAIPILSQITGVAQDDPTLRYALLALMSHCLMLMIVNPDLPSPLQPIFQRPAEEIADHIKGFVFAGLKSMSIKGE